MPVPIQVVERSDAPGESDRALVERTLAGDHAAFGDLVRRHLSAAHATANRIVRERSDADDVCQDAFLAALVHLETFDPARSFRGWLHEIVKHRAFDLRRKQAVRATDVLGHGPGEVDVVAPRRDQPDVLAERRDLRGRLASVIATLAEPYRSVLLLHDFEGFRHAEIAETLGCATGTSRHHLFVARRLVRLRLAHPPSAELSGVLRATVRHRPSRGDDRVAAPSASSCPRRRVARDAGEPFVRE